MPSLKSASLWTRKSDAFDKIQQLRGFYGDELTAIILGVRRITLGYKDQLVPVVRVAYLMHRLTFPDGKPVSLFQLFTCGKYDRTPQEVDLADGDWSV